MLECFSKHSKKRLVLRFEYRTMGLCSACTLPLTWIPSSQKSILISFMNGLNQRNEPNNRSIPYIVFSFPPLLCNC